MTLSDQLAMIALSIALIGFAICLVTNDYPWQWITKGKF